MVYYLCSTGPVKTFWISGGLKSVKDCHLIAIHKTFQATSRSDQILPGAVPEAVVERIKAPESLPPLVNGSSRRNSSSSNVKSNSSSRRNSHANGMENFLKSGKMDLEATNTAGGNGLKKAPFGRRLSNSSVKTNASKTSSAGSRKSGKLPPV